MNPVEIEEAVSALAEEPFNRAEFPYQFLLAFGNPETTIRRLRSGSTNQSDIEGGVLQRSSIHIATCARGEVDATLLVLRESPKTASTKAKFILATDGEEFQAEDVATGETVACSYPEFPDHFGFFLPLAGITTVEQIRESSFDIKATGRLNRLYVQLLKENPDWAKPERRPDMNHFMARLIFCFFAEDTDIFHPEGLFTKTVSEMSARDSSDTHTVIGEIFRAMDTKLAEREATKLPRYALKFPYVNGQLFCGSTECPSFSKIARSYLLHIGSLNWRKINPDIFGSMIQAVAEDAERGALGMHYTSVPNILKVLNPLFLGELRARLEEAGDNGRKLLNLRNRMARIRVFDPACGSGNFLVIAYKQMREIEAEINRRRGEPERRSDIPLTNFRGIELRDFPAEIARLALIIAEFQSDVLHRGQKEALAEFLPLDSQNWITCGNALRLDWLSVCPPTGTGVRVRATDLFETPLDQSEIDFENAGGETYICGNPPYLGARDQDIIQKNDIKELFAKRDKNWKSLDYVSGWFLKAALYGCNTDCASAFVTTNSVCQGGQVSILWPLIFQTGHQIFFAHTSFNWKNLASHNAGVTVVVVGIDKKPHNPKLILSIDDSGRAIELQCAEINAYLAPAKNIIVEKSSSPLGCQAEMTFGNTPIDGGNLLLTREEKLSLNLSPENESRLIRKIYGSAELIRGLERYCLWISDEDLPLAKSIPAIAQRIEAVRKLRIEGGDTAKYIANRPHQFQRMLVAKNNLIVVPVTSSENREYLPVGILTSREIVLNTANAAYDAPLWNLAIIACRLMQSWIGTVCIRMRTDFRFTPTLGWNTFPLPNLTEKNKADLTRCAENILLAREAHFPATIAELYVPDRMPEDLRRAHEANDEVIERIYIGRRFRNDTERLEKLFELYTKMTTKKAAA